MRGATFLDWVAQKLINANLEKKNVFQDSLCIILSADLKHENPHRGFFGSLLEALVAMDANIDLIKCSKI